MFPTPVGMNHISRQGELGRIHVPHTRGDEPALELMKYTAGRCSPHPWG